MDENMLIHFGYDLLLIAHFIKSLVQRRNENTQHTHFESR